MRLLPPSSQPASVSVNITIGGLTKTYTYSTSDQLEAGYKINISGTYTEAVGVSLTGTITGATWLGERTISFDFDESGSTGTENEGNPENPDNPQTPENPETDIPAVGDTYQGCYVLAVTDTGVDVDILLLSPDETTCLGTDNAVQTALGNCGTADIDDWAVPTKQQMQLVEALLLSTDATLAGTNYLFRRTNGALGFRTLGDEENAWPTASTTTTYRLRPVAIVTISKE